ncbi:MAG: M67 family metallopeptidase [Synechococcus sp.]
MSLIWPERITFRRQGLTCLTRLLSAARPREGCALLLGRGGGPTWEVERIWPCCNVWEPAAERRRRFAIDPREQLLAQKWGRSRQLQVLGSAHSHPATAPQPSPTDCLLAFPPALLVIAGVPAGASGLPGGWELRCWWLGEENTTPQPLAWTMVD